jgi:hypothetical protein
MAKTVLLTLGRLPKALALARLLHRAGHRVVVAEPFRWHLCRVSRAVSKCYRVTAPNQDLARYLSDLSAIIEREHITDVVPVSEEVVHLSALIPMLPDSVRWHGPNATQIHTWHDKYEFIDYARNANCNVPESHCIRSAAAQQLVNEYACVIKPRRGCSGQGLKFLAVGEPLDAEDTEDAETIVQRGIEGQLLSTLSWVSQGRVVATRVYRGHAFSGTVAVAFESVTPTPQIIEWITRFVNASPFSGFVSFDFIVDNDGTPWGIECNPRLSSGVHFLDDTRHPLDLLEHDVDLKSVDCGSAWRQWGYSTLTEAYRHLFAFRLKEFARHLRILWRADDVVWRRADPWPFLLMTPLSIEILWPAIRFGLSLGEASQRDIAWLWHRPKPQSGETFATGGSDEH